MKPRLFAIVCVLITVTLSGCALTTDKIDIQYSQTQGVSQITGANQVTVTVEVLDQRHDKSKVSSKKNGFGMEMAAIVPSDDVAVTIRKALEGELRARGFALGTSDAIVLINADLTRFYNDFKTGFFAGDAVADLNLSVSVKSKAGKLLYTKQIVTQGKEVNIQIASGDNAQLALNRALDSGIKALFADSAFIAALMASNSAKTAP